MNVYRQALRLRSAHVDMHRRLRTSELFRLLQEAAIRHTEALGMGREKTLDRGILWVLGLQTAQIRRMPVYDEEIVVKSWPGETMHVLFPRCCTVETASGEVLVRSSALWTLVDAQTRKLVFPETAGIVIPGVLTGDELPLPAPPRPLDCTEQTVFTVPYSYVDLNGHMNNSRYFDLAEDLTGAAAAGRAPAAVTVEYAGEARCGQTLTVSWGRREQTFFLSGAAAGKQVFRMSLTYAEP